MWWFFSKKRNKWVKKELSKIHNILSNSFFNIKEDIEQLRQNHEDYEDKILEIHNYIRKLNTAVDVLLRTKKSKTMKEFLNEIPEKNSSNWEEKIWGNLTNVQKSLILKLNILIRESDSKWISMKYLAQELYPNSPYTNIKAMISNYTDTLLGLGLLKKKRKGREIFLTPSEKVTDKLPKKSIEVKNKRLNL